MARGKKHTPEQVVNLLRQIEVAVANGKTTAVGRRAAHGYPFRNALWAEGSGCRVVLTARENPFVGMRVRKEYAEVRTSDT